jgi:hypothetical protein
MLSDVGGQVDASQISSVTEGSRRKSPPAKLLKERRPTTALAGAAHKNELLLLDGVTAGSDVVAR